MGFQQPRVDDREAHILPLINVVFLLLIFFMVAGSLTAIEPFEVDVPESVSQAAGEPDAMSVLLGRDGQLALDGEMLDRAAVLNRIEAGLAADPQLRIQLKADAQIAGNRVVLLMEGLRAAGVERLRLLTLPTSE